MNNLHISKPIRLSANWSASWVGFLACCLALFGALLPVRAYAQEVEPVSSKLEAYIVTAQENGKERFRKADRVTPGQLIEYRIFYKNNTDEALGGFTINGDVPTSTAYLVKSQKVDASAVFQAEIADLGWVDVPAFREIKSSDGSTEKVQIAAEEYQSLRWRLAESLAPGREVQVTYRIKVSR